MENVAALNQQVSIRSAPEEKITYAMRGINIINKQQKTVNNRIMHIQKETMTQ